MMSKQINIPGVSEVYWNDIAQLQANIDESTGCAKSQSPYTAVFCAQSMYVGGGGGGVIIYIYLKYQLNNK